MSQRGGGDFVAAIARSFHSRGLVPLPIAAERTLITQYQYCIALSQSLWRLLRVNGSRESGENDGRSAEQNALVLCHTSWRWFLGSSSGDVVSARFALSQAPVSEKEEPISYPVRIKKKNCWLE